MILCPIDREGVSYFSVMDGYFTAVVFRFYFNLVVPKWIPNFFFFSVDFL